MAKKLWLLHLPESYNGPRQEGIDVCVIADDDADQAKAAADVLFPGFGGAWVDHSTSQDLSVTPTGDAIVVGIERKTVPMVAVPV